MGVVRPFSGNNLGGEHERGMDVAHGQSLAREEWGCGAIVISFFFFYIVHSSGQADYICIYTQRSIYVAYWSTNSFRNINPFFTPTYIHSCQTAKMGKERFLSCRDCAIKNTHQRETKKKIWLQFPLEEKELHTGGGGGLEEGDCDFDSVFSDKNGFFPSQPFFFFLSLLRSPQMQFVWYVWYVVRVRERKVRFSFIFYYAHASMKCQVYIYIYI